jgi:Flp pilus assembly protein TadD
MRSAVANIGNSIRVYWIDEWPQADADSVGEAFAAAQIELADALLFDLKWQSYAAVHYRQSVSNGHQDKATLSKLGIALFESGEMEASITPLRRVTVLDPLDGDAHYRLAVALLQNRVLEEAATHAQTALRLRPEDPVMTDLVGVTHAVTGNLQAAKAAFERAIELQPSFEVARNHLQALNAFSRGPR